MIKVCGESIPDDVIAECEKIIAQAKFTSAEISAKALSMGVPYKGRGEYFMRRVAECLAQRLTQKHAKAGIIKPLRQGVWAKV
jgi:hypothetical protein